MDQVMHSIIGHGTSQVLNYVHTCEVWKTETPHVIDVQAIYHNDAQSKKPLFKKDNRYLFVVRLDDIQKYLNPI